MTRIKECTVIDLYNDFLKYAEEEKLFDVVPDKEKLCKYLLTEKDGKGFFCAPASTKYHGNYPGGLYEHSRNVYFRLKDLTEKNSLQWMRPQSPFIIGMFHDLCKCDQYNKVFDETREIVNGKIIINCGKNSYKHNKIN